MLVCFKESAMVLQCTCEQTVSEKTLSNFTKMARHLEKLAALQRVRSNRRLKLQSNSNMS